MTVTALLLNWKRPENLVKVISSIRSQTVPIEIFLWNNNKEDTTNYDVDLQINSSKNLMCYPRWTMCNYTNSEYVFSLDDDLIFGDEKVVEDILENIGESSFGYCGVKLNKEKNYWSSKHTHHPETDDVYVDILKGKFIITKRKNLENLEIPTDNPSIQNPRFEDDIYISSKLKNKVIPSILKGRLVKLPEPHGLWHQASHEDSRSNFTKKYFE